MSGLLPEVAILCAPTMRSRAYLQALLAAKIRPAACLLMPGSEPTWQDRNPVTVDLRGHGHLIEFDPGMPIRDSIDALDVPCVEIVGRDVNSADVRTQIAGIPQSIIVYSGFGGALLGQDTLALGKKFLHVHGGYLPDYRGSTAFYFSILERGKLGASAIWLDEGIDTGPLLARREYPIVPGLEIDRLGDPLVRADLLIEVLQERIKTGTYPVAQSPAHTATAFYVIHPVLKHLALRKCELGKANHAD